MRLIQRYILAQVLIYSAMTIGGFLFILLAGTAMRDALGLFSAGKIGVWEFVKVLGLMMPHMLAYALPFGILTAVLLVFGRLSSQRELTALKSAGVSLYAIAAPVFLVGMASVALAIIINLYYKPLSKRAVRYQFANSIKGNPLNYIKDKTFIDDFPGYVIYVGSRNGNEMKDFWIWELDAQSRATIFIKAESGVFSYDEGSESIVLTLNQGMAETRQKSDPEKLQSSELPIVSFEKSTIRLPLDSLVKYSDSDLSTSKMTLGELLDRRKATFSPGFNPEEAARERMNVQFYIHKSFANAFTVISFILIGIPLGIKTARSETSMNLAIALALVLVYFGMTTVVTFFDEHIHLRPDLLMWIPNIIYQALGCFLFVRANNH